MFNQKILAEQGEVFKSPNGQIKKISNNAPSHDDDKRVNKFGINKVNKGDGGVEIDADSVLSDSYRQVENGNRENNVKEQIVKIKPIEGESIAGQLGLDIRLKKAVSPSQLFLAIQKAKDKQTLKILGKSKNTTDTREGSNSNAVNASQLSTLPTDEEIYNAVFEHTEEKKENSGIDFNEEVEAQFGGSTLPFTNMQRQNNISKEEKQYRNPEKKFETISTDDYALDFLYDNDWLLDTPIVGDYLKKKAKSIAEISDSPFRDTPDYNIKVDPTKEKRYSGEGFRMNQGTPQKTALLDVFFGDSKLPNSKYKPKSDYLEFLPSYSIKDEKDIDTNTLNTYIKQGFYGETDPKDIDKQFNSFLKNKTPIYRKYNEDSYFTLDILNRNLGGHKEGIAWDEEKNLPYLSISDAWDFEPTNYSEKWTVGGGDELKRRAYKQSYLLNKAGNPFKIYDRFYFDPKTKEYIPDEQLEKFNIKKKQFGGSSILSELNLL